MGIPRGTARLLLDEARQRPFSGRLLELGRMAVHCTEREVRTWAAAQGVRLADPGPPELSHLPELAAQGCLSDRTFFRLLGFDKVESADVSDWERPDHLLDLNLPLPEPLRGRYDAVFEAGTLQHVFHLPQALANVHDLLRPEGRVVHGMAPSSNHVDHGFYMFSPTLFHDFYADNGWRLEAELFFEFLPFWVGGRFDSTVWRVRRYEPGCLDHLAYGGFRGWQVGLFVAATRRAGATADRIPQQSYFARFHAGRASSPPVPAAAPAPWVRPWKRLRARVLRLLPRRLPPVVARY